MLQEAIKWAKTQVGKQEYPHNHGFKDKTFDMIMRRVGFENGWAWCALFSEASWSYPTYEGKSKIIASISDNFSANAIRTFENFKKDTTGLFKIVSVSEKPSPGDVVIWEKRKDREPVKKGIWTLGHAGIVEEVHEDYFISIEGNSNSSGGREGIEVARHRRTYNYNGQNGLCLKGFITTLINDEN